MAASEALASQHGQGVKDRRGDEIVSPQSPPRHFSLFGSSCPPYRPFCCEASPSPKGAHHKMAVPVRNQDGRGKAQRHGTGMSAWDRCSLTVRVMRCCLVPGSKQQLLLPIPRFTAPGPLLEAPAAAGSVRTHVRCRPWECRVHHPPSLEAQGQQFGSPHYRTP